MQFTSSHTAVFTSLQFNGTGIWINLSFPLVECVCVLSVIVCCVWCVVFSVVSACVVYLVLSISGLSVCVCVYLVLLCLLC